MWDREGIGGQAIGRETRDTRYGRDVGERREALRAASKGNGASKGKGKGRGKTKGNAAKAQVS